VNIDNTSAEKLQVIKTPNDIASCANHNAETKFILRKKCIMTPAKSNSLMISSMDERIIQQMQINKCNMAHK
jgi:hypothetical protein